MHAYPVMMAVPANKTLVTGGIELKTAEKSAMMCMVYSWLVEER
jgi:hypothetical protein